MMDDDQHEAYGAMIHRGKVEQQAKEAPKVVKLCKDCKWARPDRVLFVFPWWEFTKCDAPPNRVHSVVDGAWKRRWELCYVHRTHNDDDVCGPDAKWFEPKAK
jgi:hypothetical protein